MCACHAALSCSALRVTAHVCASGCAVPPHAVLPVRFSVASRGVCVMQDKTACAYCICAVFCRLPACLQANSRTLATRCWASLGSHWITLRQSKTQTQAATASSLCSSLRSRRRSCKTACVGCGWCVALQQSRCESMCRSDGVLQAVLIADRVCV